MTKTIVLIVGPSGVGKSTACNAVKPEFTKLLFEDLDVLAGRWAHRNAISDSPDVHVLHRKLQDAARFLEIGLSAITELTARPDNRPIVIDVGAGFQEAAGAKKLYRLYPCITISAAPEVVYGRIRKARNDSRTLVEYIQGEFNQHRLNIYGASPHQIDTSSQTIEQTAEALGKVLRQLFG